MHKIFIPSKGRWDPNPKTPTNKMISYLNVCKNVDYKFVIEPSEVEQYKKILKEDHIVIMDIEDAGFGINNTTVWILNYTSRLQIYKFFIIDDDIFLLLKRKSWNEEKKYWIMEGLEDWSVVFDEFLQYKDQHFPLMSINFKQTGWLFKESITEFTRCVAFVYYNFDALRYETGYDIFFEKLERFEAKKYTLYIDNYIMASIISMGYKTININNYNFGTPVAGSEEGGCKPFYEKDNHQLECASYVASFFPEFSKIIQKKKRIEVRLKWKEIYEDAKKKLKQISTRDFF